MVHPGQTPWYTSAAPCLPVVLIAYPLVYFLPAAAIFGRWFKALSEGKSKADVIKDMLVKDAWNPALLDLPPDALVPEIPATTCPLKDWPLLEQFAKMSKVSQWPCSSTANGCVVPSTSTRGSLHVVASEHRIAAPS